MLDTDSNRSAQSPERPSVQLPSAHLEAPRPAHRQPTQGRHSTSAQETATRVRSYQMEPSSNRLSTDYPPHGRPTYQPRRSSGLRYSHIDENSDALNALEGRRTGTVEQTSSQGMRNFVNAFRRIQPEFQNTEPHELLLMLPNPGYLIERRAQGHARSASALSNGDERYAQRRPPLVRDPSDILFDPAFLPKNQQQVVDSNQSTNVNASGKRRRSQVAEEGQLLPRVRVSNAANGFAPSTLADHRIQFNEFTAGGNEADPFATPLGTPMGSPEALGEPSPFARFVDSTPRIDNRIEPLDESDTSPTSSEEGSALQSADGNRQLRQSHAVRKGNSGFEILRPGAMNGSHHAFAGDRSRDLEKGERWKAEISDNKRGQNRLQKTRARADSKESRFKEQV